MNFDIYSEQTSVFDGIFRSAHVSGPRQPPETTTVPCGKELTRSKSCCLSSNRLEPTIATYIFFSGVTVNFLIYKISSCHPVEYHMKQSVVITTMFNRLIYFFLCTKTENVTTSITAALKSYPPFTPRQQNRFFPALLYQNMQNPR
jgi:hypothetical protein